MVGGNEIVGIIIVAFGERVLEVFGGFPVLATVTLMDKHGREVKFGSGVLDHSLLGCSKSAVFSDFGFSSVAGDVNDGLIIELSIVCCGDIHEILKPLEVLVIVHIALSQGVEVGFGLIKCQGKELLVFKSESDCLNKAY